MSRKRNLHKRNARQLRFESLEHRRVLAPITVDTFSDVVDVQITNIPDLIVNRGLDGKISLREAILAANNTQFADTITFAPSLFGQTITLGKDELGISTGVLTELSITDSLTIDATDGMGNLLGITIDASGNDPTPDNTISSNRGDGTSVFRINLTGVDDVALKGLRITGGDVEGNGGGVFVRSNTDFIAKIDISESVITGNLATVEGGGLYVGLKGEGSKLSVIKSQITGNTAGQDGGGLHLRLSQYLYPNNADHSSAVGSKLLIQESIFSGNKAANRGGGLRMKVSAGGEMEIQNSVISGNEAGIDLAGLENVFEIPNSGGGIYAYMFSDQAAASLTISGSEISGNTAGEHGGGITICTKRENNTGAISRLDVINSTISGNQAGHTTALNKPGTGGGVHLAIYPGESEEALDTSFQHSTITGNTADKGGGIYSFKPSLSDARNDVKLTNTIISGNNKHSGAANNFYGSINATQTDYNLFGHEDGVVANEFFDHASHSPITFLELGSNNINDTDNDPGLLVLDFYGGLTKTHMLKASSDARDTGDPLDQAGVGGTPSFDQRGTGYDRVLGATPPDPSVIDIGAVEFILGDYNYNGVVDAADYTVWRDTYDPDNPNSTDLDADGNGNGIIDIGDHLIWANNFSDNTAFGQAIGDYNGDGVVDHLDYVIWNTNFGSTTELEADGNGNGIIDAADYTHWRDHAGSTIDVGNNTTTNLRFQFLSSTSGVIYVVSTTADELDGDHSFGDLSLREAVQMANATTNATILVVAGRYTLTRTGTEAGDASYNDLDISSEVKIIGDGAGVTIIEGGATQITNASRAFHVLAGGASLDLSSVTIVNDSINNDYGNAILVDAGSELLIEDSAFTNNVSYAGGTAVYANGADVVVRRSVFTNNEVMNGSGAGINVVALGQTTASLTIGDSIFALNVASFPYAPMPPNVSAGGNVTKVNEGNNLYDDATGGFFDTTSGVNDHLGTPDYVVTSVADTFDHTNNNEVLSIREAIDLANQASGQQEIWLPAWDFVLTRDRQTYGGGSATDIDIAFGDLDISDDLIIRGVTGKTSVVWKAGIVDAVFDLLGDYNNSGQADYNNVSAADYTIWAAENGSGSGTSSDWEMYAADGDDDGDVDQDDYDIWVANYGNSLDLFDIAAG